MLLKISGILLIMDGVGSVVWYKEELKPIPTFFRLMRTVIGVALVMAG